MDDPSADLLAKYRDGDEQAASELFRRYVSRLTVLVRARMASKIARRFDAEDVVLSAYRSFFVRARDGQFSLAESGDLWRLLVNIVLKKLYRQAAHHTADKRSVDREQPLPVGGDSLWDALMPATRDPTAEEAVAMAELVEAFMEQLDPVARQVVELRLQGLRIAEIVAVTKRSDRTIRRILEDLKERLETMLLDPADNNRSIVPVRESPQIGKLSKAFDAVEMPPPEMKSAVPSVEANLLADFQSDQDFVLQLHLGTGGTGKVYRAFDRRQRQLVAVKMLKKASQHDRAAVARFLDEAWTVARLRHPGIVAIHGIGRTRSGGYFLVEDLVDGQSLSRLAEGRRIEVAEAVHWIAEAADTVDYAHRQGVVHCDLKPANLLLDSAGRLRVTDFGLAQIVVPGARSRAAIAGTAGFMAPEQLDLAWGSIGPRTDVFGLGAVLYALLVRRPPFAGKTIDELLQAMFETSPAGLLRLARPEVPAEIERICAQCLAMAPNDRFATAAALAHALRSQV